MESPDTVITRLSFFLTIQIKHAYLWTTERKLVRWLGPEVVLKQ